MACKDHRPFKTAEAALEHYVAQVREGRTDPGQQVFRCKRCRQWHHGGSKVRSLGRALTEARVLRRRAGREEEG